MMQRIANKREEIMVWTYNDTTANLLYSKWSKLGWRSTEDLYKDNVDVEELIAETTHAARYDGRLLQVLLTWCRDFGDLINNRRLMRFINLADTAVLGVVLEITMHYGGYQNFIPIIKQCHPVNPAEVLLKGFGLSRFTWKNKKCMESKSLRNGDFSAHQLSSMMMHSGHGNGFYNIISY